MISIGLVFAAPHLDETHRVRLAACVGVARVAGARVPDADRRARAYTLFLDARPGTVKSPFHDCVSVLLMPPQLAPGPVVGAALRGSGDRGRESGA